MNEVLLKRLHRERGIPQSHDKGMVNEMMPDCLDVWPIEEILDETTAEFISVLQTGDFELHSRWKG